MQKIITVVIVILLALGFGFYLYKISPNTETGVNSTYNANINTTGAKTISEVPAFDPETDRFQGDPKSKNVFIEYSDYQCPACAAASEMLKQVPSQFMDTVFVYRYFPLTQIHQNSVESAVAAEAAGEQGKYWEMHDILFANQADWEGLAAPLEVFAQYAQQIGVADIAKFKTDVTEKKNLEKVQKNTDEAYGLNLQGTPTYFFNGHPLQNSDMAGLLKQAEPFRNK